MINKLSYNHKCTGLFISFLLLLLLGYKLSFSKTFESRLDIKKKEEKISWLKEKEKDIPVLKAKMALIEEAYSSSDSLSIRDKLTAFISDYAENNNCVVTEIPEHSSFARDNLKVQTNTFTIKGRFKDLLNLQFEVERKFKLLARIMSAHFFTVGDFQSKRKNLYLTITTQSFTQN